MARAKCSRELEIVSPIDAVSLIVPSGSEPKLDVAFAAYDLPGTPKSAFQIENQVVATTFVNIDNKPSCQIGRPRRRRELDGRHVTPELLEPVVLPRLRREDVEDDVEVVGQDPIALRGALDGSRPKLVVGLSRSRTSSTIAFVWRGFRPLQSTKKSV